jgi:hypothetical protein
MMSLSGASAVSSPIQVARIVSDFIRRRMPRRVGVAGRGPAGPPSANVGPRSRSLRFRASKSWEKRISRKCSCCSQFCASAPRTSDARWRFDRLANARGKASPDRRDRFEAKGLCKNNSTFRTPIHPGCLRAPRRSASAGARCGSLPRHAGRLVGCVPPVCALLAPCQPGASAPQFVDLFLHRPLGQVSPSTVVRKGHACPRPRVDPARPMALSL